MDEKLIGFSGIAHLLTEFDRGLSKTTPPSPTANDKLATQPIGFSGICRLLTDLDDELSMDGKSSKENKDTIRHKISGHTIERKDGDPRVFTWWVIVICLVLLVLLFFSAVGSGNNKERASTSYLAERSVPSRTSNGTSRYSTNQSTTAKRTRSTNNNTTRNNHSRDTVKLNQSENPSKITSERDYSFPDESVPPSGTGYTLTKQQLKYCLAEDLRISAASGIFDSKKQILDEKFSVLENSKETDLSTVTEYDISLNRMEKLVSETRLWKLKNSVGLNINKLAYESECRYYYLSDYCRSIIREFAEIIISHMNDEVAIQTARRHKLNSSVDNYNNRCAKYQYYKDDMELARSEIRSRQERYIEQGSRRME